MNGELKRLRDVERWIGWIRAVAVPFAAFQVAIGSGYPARLPGLGVGHDHDLRGGRGRSLPPQSPGVAAAGTAAVGAGCAHLRLRDRLGLRPRLQLRAGFPRPSDHVSAARRGGAALRDPWCSRPRGRQCPGDGDLRMVARTSRRAAELPPRLRHSAARDRSAHGSDRRLARAAAGRPDGGRRDEGGGGRASARPARPARRHARGRQPLRPGAQLVAPAGAGLRRLHPRGARVAPVRPGRDRAQRGGKGPGDGRGRRGRGRGTAARLGAADPRNAAGGAAAHEPDCLSARHGGGRFPRGGGVPRAGPALPARDAAASGGACDRDALARPARAGVVHGGGDRVGGPARQARGERGAEHPGLRSRAQDRRGAAAPVGAARGLRLARLARAAHANGGGDRLGAHAAAALARALA